MQVIKWLDAWAVNPQKRKNRPEAQVSSVVVEVGDGSSQVGGGVEHELFPVREVRGSLALEVDPDGRSLELGLGEVLADGSGEHGVLAGGVDGALLLPDVPGGEFAAVESQGSGDAVGHRKTDRGREQVPGGAVALVQVLLLDELRDTAGVDLLESHVPVGHGVVLTQGVGERLDVEAVLGLADDLDRSGDADAHERVVHTQALSEHLLDRAVHVGSDLGVLDLHGSQAQRMVGQDGLDADVGTVERHVHPAEAVVVLEHVGSVSTGGEGSVQVVSRSGVAAGEPLGEQRRCQVRHNGTALADGAHGALDDLLDTVPVFLTVQRSERVDEVRDLCSRQADTLAVLANLRRADGRVGSGGHCHHLSHVKGRLTINYTIPYL